MSQCVRPKNKIVITQINENQYLVEGESKWARFGCQADTSIITSANLEGGPFLLVGDNFLGKGRISAIQYIDSGQDNYIILKITLYSKED